MHRSVALLLVAGLLAPLSDGRAQDIPTTPPSATASILRPGDAVRITVWRKPELSGEFLVTEDGVIAHPLYREIQVGGRSVGEARAQVLRYLAALETNPQFVLEGLLSVSVGGEIRQPGLQRLPAGTTITQAVATAGGITERAKLTEVRLTRGGQVTRFDLTQAANDMADIPIRSGDQIYVPARGSLYRDVIVPAASVTAALATIITVILRL